jgi:hypothetical protein
VVREDRVQVEEVAARGGKIILIGDRHAIDRLGKKAFATIAMPVVRSLRAADPVLRAGAAARLPRRRWRRAPTSTSRATSRRPSPSSSACRSPSRAADHAAREGRPLDRPGERGAIALPSMPNSRSQLQCPGISTQ